MKRILMKIGLFTLLLSLVACEQGEQDESSGSEGPQTASPFANSGSSGVGSSSYVPPSSRTTQPVQDTGIEPSDVSAGEGDATGGVIEAGDVGDQTDGTSSGEGGGPCNPNCGGKNCGDDGCGGSCGECPLGSSCDGVVCINEAFGACAAAEGQYQGTFSGLMSFGANGLPDFNLDTTGAIVMTMDCASLEATLEGTFSGAIADTTYTLTLDGSADFGKGELEWTMGDGSVLAVGGQVLYQVEGLGVSTEFNGTQWTGTWSIDSISASSVGGNLSAGDIKPLSGSGDWAMGKVP